MLEIAHTHYWIYSQKDVRENSLGDGAMSPMSERSVSPYNSRENLSMQSHPASSDYSLSKARQPAEQQTFQIQTTGSIVTQLGK